MSRGQQDGSIKWEKEQVDSLILAAFMKGLRGEAAAQLHYNPPSKFQEAVNRAARVELYQSQGSSVREVRGINEQTTLQVAAATLPQWEKGRQTKCFRCNQYGHFARECVQRRGREGRRERSQERKQCGETPLAGASKGGFCFVCGDPKHFARNCTFRAKEARAGGKYLNTQTSNEFSPKGKSSV